MLFVVWWYLVLCVVCGVLVVGDVVVRCVWLVCVVYCFVLLVFVACLFVVVCLLLVVRCCRLCFDRCVCCGSLCVLRCLLFVVVFVRCPWLPLFVVVGC